MATFYQLPGLLMTAQTCAFSECYGPARAEFGEDRDASWRYYQRAVAGAAGRVLPGRRGSTGRWDGRGLAQLGLSRRGGTEAQLEAMFARGAAPGHRAAAGSGLAGGWGDRVRLDVLGAEVSVSAVGDRWPADRGRRWRRRTAAAVLAGLDYLDTHAALSRRGTDGLEQIGTAGLAAALFDHRTSRAGDPQLHTHALVVNKVRCADGVWRTIDGHEVYHHKKAAGMIYQAALRAELTPGSASSSSEPNRHGQAEIAGVPAELIGMWSKRTAEIDAEAGTGDRPVRGRAGPGLTAGERAAVVKTAVLKTRPGKTPAEPRRAARAWAAEAAAARLDCRHRA